MSSLHIETTAGGCGAVHVPEFESWANATSVGLKIGRSQTMFPEDLGSHHSRSQEQKAALCPQAVPLHRQSRVALSEYLVRVTPRQK
jgi:hypothetical protein